MIGFKLEVVLEKREEVERTVGTVSFLAPPLSGGGGGKAIDAIYVRAVLEDGARRRMLCTVPSSCYPAPSLEPIFGQCLGSGGSTDDQKMCVNEGWCPTFE